MNDTNGAAASADAVAAPDAVATVAVAGGSVTGRHHRRLDRPCQDAWAMVRAHDIVIAAVCDGCGSGRHSEVGAALGAQLWMRAVVESYRAGRSIADAACWSEARRRVVEVIGGLVDAIAGSRDVSGDDARVAAVVDSFLFTSLVAAITPEHAAVYAVGDGIVALDGDVRVLGPFAGDQPPYIGYDLLGASPPPTAFLLLPAASVRTIVLGTDGAGELAGADPDGLAALWCDDRFVRNPDAIRRWLAVVNQERLGVDPEHGTIVRGGQPLSDDTTVVVLRRRLP